MTYSNIQRVREEFLRLQREITLSLETLDKQNRFEGNVTKTPLGGMSKPRILSQGQHVEKSAVHFTHSVGKSLPQAATKRNPNLGGRPFQAVSISVIVHPRNPFVPTAHMNLRFFEVESGESSNETTTWYFGGGFDLTPFYPFHEDVIHWHQMAFAACENSSIYTRFKKQCDEYFFLTHRQEPRGIGGLFFDDWSEGGFETSFHLVSRIGNHFWQAYGPIFEKRMTTPWSEAHEEWMLIRRGRYAEFNLAIDRGTKYGLQSGRRIENVLSSLPPRAMWIYDHKTKPGSQEQSLIQEFLPPRDWIKNLSVDKCGDKLS